MLRSVLVSAVVSSLLTAGIVIGSNRVIADDLTAHSVALGNAFTYQGRLTEDGVPVSGARDFEFVLFDAASAGAPVGTPIVVDDLAVANGLFSLQMDFGPSAFNGEGRWLEVRARAAASGPYTTIGRQELTATPYALYAKSVGDHSHFGDTWSGDLDGPALFVENTNDEGSGLEGKSPFQGVVGRTDDGNCGQGIVPSGVLGVSCASTGVQGISDTGVGVQGESATKNAILGVSRGAGEFGAAIRAFHAGSIFNACPLASIDTIDMGSLCIAIAGRTQGQGSLGIYGKGQTGVYGEANENGGQAVRGNGLGFSTGVAGFSTRANFAGTYGLNNNGAGVSGVGGTGVVGATTAVNGVGVEGKGGDNGNGVVGRSSRAGYAAVFGENLSGPGVYGRGDVGVWGVADAPGSTAGQFDGRVLVNGLLDGPSAQVKIPHLIPDLNVARNLGFSNLAWKFVVSENFSNPSDARLKTNVLALSYGLETVEALRPVSYTRTEGDGKVQLGLIAQEVREVIPEVVSEDAEGEHLLSLDYSRLVPVLIRAIQEQQAEIENLKASIAALD